MKWKRGKEFRCVQGIDANDFQNKVNEVLRVYPDAQTVIDMQMPFTCHMWITKEVNIPETLAEEYELRGEVYYCDDCPYLQKTEVGNRKKFPCRYATYGLTRCDSMACSRFYAEVIEGREYVPEDDRR